jgi:hypothetical protein
MQKLFNYLAASMFALLLTSTAIASHFSSALKGGASPGVEYGFWACIIVVIASIAWGAVGTQNNIHYLKTSVTCGFLIVFAGGAFALKSPSTVLANNWVTGLSVVGVGVYIIGLLLSEDQNSRGHAGSREVCGS